MPARIPEAPPGPAQGVRSRYVAGEQSHGLCEGGSARNGSDRDLRLQGTDTTLPTSV